MNDKTKKTLRIVAIVVGVIAAIGIFANIFPPSEEKQVAAETPTVDVAETPELIEESPSYQLPPEPEFQAYVEARLYEAIDSGELYIDTILVRPVELEIAEYSLSGIGKPEIRVNAIVSEYEAGANSGRAITREIVRICLAWLIEEGFDPFAEWIMPSSFVKMSEIGETGQQLWRVWGSSTYDFNNDQIVWRES